VRLGLPAAAKPRHEALGLPTQRHVLPPAGGGGQGVVLRRPLEPALSRSRGPYGRTRLRPSPARAVLAPSSARMLDRVVGLGQLGAGGPLPLSALQSRLVHSPPLNVTLSTLGAFFDCPLSAVGPPRSFGWQRRRWTALQGGPANLNLARRFSRSRPTAGCTTRPSGWPSSVGFHSEASGFMRVLTARVRPMPGRAWAGLDLDLRLGLGC
jgi:hypothetical protein